MDHVEFEESFGDQYVLVHEWSDLEWYERSNPRLVEPSEAVEIVLSVLEGGDALDRDRLFRFLCFDRHPSNVSSGELEETVRARLEGIGYSLYLLEDDWGFGASSARPAPPLGYLTDVPKQRHGAREKHWVAAEVVDAEGKPVSGVALELQLADGALHKLVSDEAGAARFEPVPPGKVIIRLPKHAGERWRPASGPPARASTGRSGTQSRTSPTTHSVQKGESLAALAKRYGLNSWKQIWDAPENEPLRKQRPNPNLIHPGDRVHVPAMQVFEIEREVDAAHQIEVKRQRGVAAVLNTHLLDEVSALDVHWERGSSSLAAATSLYGDDASVALRLNDVPEHASVALIASVSGAQEAAADVAPHGPSTSRLA